MRTISRIIFPLLTILLAGCVAPRPELRTASAGYARYFDIVQADSCVGIVTIAPSGSFSDTMWVDRPLESIICMSTSHVAALSAIDAISVVKGVSGLRFVSDPKLDRQSVHDIGYDHAIDYETILKIKPDLLVAYAVNGAEPPYVSKLSSLGVRTLILNDHLEDHPLARAEYVRLFGALTGRQNVADSVFAEVRDRYLDLAGNVDRNDPVKVLINIPYSDAWFIPGKEGYMSKLVEDAGGVILGAPAGTSVSGIVSLEKAYGYSLEADMWLNPGSCRSRDELVHAHHMFSRFGPVANGLPIYNNIRCAGDDGGNDFWERGAVRPDLILHDLVAIFNSVRGITKEDSPEENLLFYVRL